MKKHGNKIKNDFVLMANVKMRNRKKKQIIRQKNNKKD